MDLRVTYGGMTVAGPENLHAIFFNVRTLDTALTIVKYGTVYRVFCCQMPADGTLLWLAAIPTHEFRTLAEAAEYAVAALEAPVPLEGRME